MLHFHCVILLVTLMSPLVISKPEYYESYEEEGRLGLSGYSVEDTSENQSGSDEIPLFTYDPATDGDPDAFLDKFLEDYPGAGITGEAEIRAQFRKEYENYMKPAPAVSQGKPLPKVTAADRKKIDKKLNDAELMKHNELRAMHDADPLEYDEQVAAFAQNYADKQAKKMASGAGYVHNPELPSYFVGENEFASQGAETYVGRAAGSWYEEKPLYMKIGPSMEPATLHFTQVVWKGSKKLGCGKSAVKSPGGGPPSKYLTVCNYYPSGNIKGAYDKYVTVE